MRKVILLLGVIGASLMMTSCLGDGGQYREPGYVYVDMDDKGTFYGRSLSTYAFRIITSNDMTQMEPRTFKYMEYRWDEKMGSAPILLDGQALSADKVEVIGEPEDIVSSYLNISTELPSIEDPKSFDRVETPIYFDSKAVWDDHWIIRYDYTAKKGEEARVDFYKKNGQNADEVVIYAHLVITGTPESSAKSELKKGMVALNMSSVRSLFDTSKKEIQVKFEYYENNRLTESRPNRWIINNPD
ncbi:hypothetical protein [Proteiniphilum sp.]|uniref:hypothetical protein n=1 Tax=Proteiniphilum sp. TaxID=1926877 RepID=UPI002B217C9F|nr:hypothetical protein [Proteiniphilum sp.]MEA4916398.1 hypothetical protein [Proteiniphilum sp.]